MSTTCIGCAHANRDTAKFCSACGNSLAQACTGCGAALYPGERFCSECGAQTGAGQASRPPAPPPPVFSEGERKQVTVLFADVAKSMDLAERLDPDELSQVMAGLVEVCREALEHFGGTIDKFTGDGVMALFGAPVAQEDHARRACHAALRLVESAQRYALTLRHKNIELSVRVGLNSGDVVAGSVGGGSYTAVGHTVGLAQRMESLAKPGIPYLSEHTAALVADGFLLRGLGKTEVKGSTMPVGVFALEGASGGSAAPGRRRSGSARLVGRDSELATLESALVRARGGHFQVVGIVGEAGAGKSRLCEELVSRAIEAGVSVGRTSGVSHAQGVALLPILGLLRDFFGIAGDDPAAAVRDKIAGRLLSLEPELEPELALIFDFLEVPDPDRPAPQLGPDARRRRVLEVFRRVTRKRSECQTVLFLLEDLHWFDPHSVAFLDAWLPSFPATHTLVVTNFRPEFHAPWAAHSYYHQLPLTPLDGGAVGELLGELLGPEIGLSPIARQLQARAGGNPFFTEELVRGLAGEGTLAGEPGAYVLARPASEVRVPPTVQAVLSARIDRLAPGEKNILQAAAVIGRTFTRSILTAVAAADPDEIADALTMLCSGELLQETSTSGEYRFWHPLTQEVAYGTLLGAARRRHHAATAHALIGSAPDRHEELAALIATHYEAAGDGLEAARWQLRAGTRAVRADYPEAQRQLRAARHHLAGVPPTSDSLTLGVRAAALLLRLGARTGLDLTEADQLIAQARPAADQLDDPVLLASLAISEAAFRLWSGDFAGALASSHDGRAYAERTTGAAWRAFSWLPQTVCCLYTGPLQDGLHAVGAALLLCAGDPATGTTETGYSIFDQTHCFRASLYIPAGRLDDARRVARESAALYEQRPASEWRAWTLSLFAHLAEATGDGDDAAEAEAAAREALALAEECGNIAATVRAQHAAGVAALLIGRSAEAARVLEEGLVNARQHRSGLNDEVGLLTDLARAHLALGDVQPARAVVTEAIAVAQRQGAKVVECHAHAVRARVLRESATSDADLAEARAAVATGDALATETGALTYAAFLAEERARLAPDPAAEQAGLKVAADAYAAIGATGHARRLRDELGTR